MKTLTRLLVLMCLLATNMNLFGTEYYVSVNGSDANLVGTCQTPWQTIQHALNYNLLASGDVIKVMDDGTYTENLIWPAVDGITLTGWHLTSCFPSPVGFASYVTIDGQQAGTVLTINPFATVITNLTNIQYFVITHGRTLNYGGGIYMAGYVAPIFTNVLVQSNFSLLGGGGVYYNLTRDYLFDQNQGCYLWKSMLPCQFNNCEFNSDTSNYGAGLYISSVPQTIQQFCPQIDCFRETVIMNNCNIKDNRARISGGGMYIFDAFITFTLTQMSGNHALALDGGAIWCSESKTVIKTMLLAQNFAHRNGGGIHLEIGLRHYANGCQDCQQIPITEQDHNWYNLNLLQNEAFTNGGGLHIGQPTDPPIPQEEYTNLIYELGNITDNLADNGNGGGIDINCYAQVSAKDLQIENNYAFNNGGGINNNCEINQATGAGWTLTHYFEQLIIDYNTANNYGGGICTKQTFYCLNSTIADNSSGTDGGGIACFTYFNNAVQQNVNPIFFNTSIFNNSLFGGGFNQVYLDNTRCDPYFDFCDIRDYNLPAFGFSGFGSGINYTASTWGGGNPATVYSVFPNYSPAPNYDIPFCLPPYPNLASICRNTGSNVLVTCDFLPVFSPGMFLPWNYSPNPLWASDFQNSGIRISGGIIDIGAQESFPLKSTIDNSINQVSLGSTFNFSIFPNPSTASGDMEMLFSNPNSTNVTVVVSDVLGHEIATCKTVFEGEKAIHLSEMNLELKHGVYIVKVYYKDNFGANGTSAQRIIIL